MECKLYSDVSSDIDYDISTGAFIITSNDVNIFTCSVTLNHFKDTVHVEAQAMLLGMKVAFALGCTKLTAFTDSTVLVEKIKRFKGNEHPSLKEVINHIRNFSRKFETFRYHPVESYIVEPAHNLARSRLTSLRSKDVKDIL